MKNIFITGTFRIEWNKRYNAELAAALEGTGFTCYLPQRDTEQNGDRMATFKQNVQGVREADLLLAVGVNSQTANWGFEIGLAWALGTPIIILTDKPEEASLMTAGAAAHIFSPDDINAIVEYTAALADTINSLLPRKRG